MGKLTINDFKQGLKDLILGKVDKADGKALSTNDYTNEEKTKNQSNKEGIEGLRGLISEKVDKIIGKGLSTNDYTDEEKTKNESNKENVGELKYSVETYYATKEYVDSKIENSEPGSGTSNSFKLEVFEYKFNNVPEGTLEIEIPLVSFDRKVDIVKLYINAIHRDSDFYTVVDNKIILNNAIQQASKVTVEVWKNIPTGGEGSISGVIIEPDTMPMDRVQGLEELDNYVKEIDKNNKTFEEETIDRFGEFGMELDLKVGFENDIANDLTTNVSGKVLDAKQGKVLKDDLDKNKSAVAAEFKNRTTGNVFSSTATINTLYGTSLTANSTLLDIIQALMAGDSLNNLYVQGNSNYPSTFCKLSSTAKYEGMTIYIQAYSSTFSDLYYCVLQNATTHALSPLRKLITDAPIPWINATLQSGWTGYFRYRKNAIGQLEVVFEMQSGVITQDTIISSLPPAYIPNRDCVVKAYNGSLSKVSGELLVGVPSGNIWIKSENPFQPGHIYGSAVIP